jgi:hypothetical protein
MIRTRRTRAMATCTVRTGWQAHLALDADGTIKDPQLQQRFEGNVENFMDLVEASKHYPCIKRAWVEYLGERVDPRVDRVQTAGAGGR